MDKLKNSKSKGIKWIAQNAGFALAPVILLSLLGAVMSFVAMSIAFASKNVLDVATGASNDTLASAIVPLCVLIACYIIIHIVYSVVDVKLSCTITNRLANNLYKKILWRKFADITKFHSGDLVNRLNGDVSVVTAGIMGIVPTVVQLTARVVFSFGALYLLDRNFALLCIVILPFVTVAGRIYGKRMKVLHKKSRAASGKVFSHMQEGIQNLLIIKTFVKEAASAKKLSDLQDVSMRLNVKAGIISMVANLLFFAVMTFGYYCALVWCAYKISIGIMTVGTLTAVLQLFDQLQTPFGEFSSVIPLYYKTMASVERIQEVENITPDEYGEQQLCKDFSSLYISNLSFGYGDNCVLRGANAQIPAGRMTVIGGESGTGKSTLIKLVMGVLDADCGDIYFQNQNGSRLQCGANTRANFAYVPQGNMILSGTVRSNISFYNDEVSEDDIIQSAKDACIYDYIMSLPNGFDTMLGEGGAGLSEGQVQRLAIARALCTDARVLMLDEATSALDSQTEQDLLSNIKKRSGLTSIVISHRKCAFEVADNVIYIQGCQIVQKS